MQTSDDVCPKCGSPVLRRFEIGVKFTCGAWINVDGSKSFPPTCHARRREIDDGKQHEKKEAAA